MTDSWAGCYDLSWKGIITPESFCHPAKMARGLLRRILDHAFEQGWVGAGSIVCDPFGGIGSTAIEGAYRGLQVITCELEPKFVALTKENLALHARHWTRLGCPQPVILQGDSRQLCRLVREAGCIVGSPPFQECLNDAKMKVPHDSTGNFTKNYGSTPGQLGAMKAGSVAAVVGSPPYATETIRKRDIGDGHKQGATQGKHSCDEYGTTSGQLAALPPGSVAAVLSSPPYEGTPIVQRADGGIGEAYRNGKRGKGAASGKHTQYNLENIDNIGNSIGTTFWSAAKLIVEQCFHLLPPGGHACWVVKDFVRNKVRVDFTGDWRRLCEAVGFRLVCEHQAMLTRTWTEDTLFEGRITKTTERKSFFRRLAERKGSPRIDWESVLCVRRNPEAPDGPA